MVKHNLFNSPRTLFPSREIEAQCQGCNVIVKRSGLYPHFRTSSNALCQQYRISLDSGDLAGSDDDNVSSQGGLENWAENHSAAPDVEGERTRPKVTNREAEAEEQDTYMPQDVDESKVGDDDYWQDMDISEYKDQDADTSLTESESKYEDLAASLALDECRLEPIRPSIDITVNEDEEDLPQKPGVFRLRGGYEDPLKNDPFVVKFPGMAGRPCTVNDDEEMDAAPTTTNGDTSDLEANPFAPFLSKMEWEIARWAKLRGPGLTAFSELISIDGVRFF